MVKIANRTVLIVGGTAGTGRGLARRFAAVGSTVIVGGRNPEPQGGLEAVRIDVTDPDSILRARDEVLGAHPGLDVVVTNATARTPNSWSGGHSRSTRCPTAE